MSPRQSDSAQQVKPHPASRPAQKKRIRNFSADDRAAHAEFEKSRREAFREQLTVSGPIIPTLPSRFALAHFASLSL